MNMQNVHGMFIYICIENRDLELRKTRNDFSDQVRNCLLTLSLKVFRHKKSEAQSFYSGFFICPAPNTCGTRHKVTGLASASKRKPTVFSRSRTQLYSTSSISQNPLRTSGTWRHLHCVTPFPISAYCVISEWYVRSTIAWTPILMLHQSNPCTEPKDSQPN